MATITACRRYPYPLDGDPPDVAGDFGKLARAIDTDVCTLASRLTQAEGTALNAVRKTGDNMTGALTIAPPTIPLVLRRSGSVVDQPGIAFQSLSGTPQFATILGTSAGLIFNTDSGVDAHDFRTASTTRLKITASVTTIGPLLEVTGPVRARTTGGAQFQSIDSDGGHATYLAFYGSGSASATGTRTGLVGYAASTTLQLRNEVSGGNVTLTTTGIGTIDFSPSGTLTLRLDGTAVLFGKAESDLANSGVEILATGSSAEGSIRSTIGASSAIPNLYLRHNGTSAAAGMSFIDFLSNSTSISRINQITSPGAGVQITNAVLTAPSDYRLKNDLGPITRAVERVRQLRPRRITWKSDPDEIEWDAFLAHEVSEVVPEAVYGEKDGTNDDGTLDPQQLDPSRLIPLLTAAVIELSARLSVLEGVR